MFTGIITDLGRVRGISKLGGARIEFFTSYNTIDVAIGASVACSGVCLTVVEKGKDWLATDVSEETLSKTTITNWGEGRIINLERPLRPQDEIGGHIVTGHIDGVGTVTSIEPVDESLKILFKSPNSVMRHVAPKGSIAVDGVSLTVNEVIGDEFSVSIIPHTQKVTTFGVLDLGDLVNLEIDLLSRYVAQLLKKEDQRAL